jgi:hypothetical protein
MIPKIDQYYAAGMNLLLVGLHGVGKTEAILTFCRENGVVLKYYSCSTLDPYTDLVGVPTPRKYCMNDRVWLGTNQDQCPICNHRLEEEDSPVVESLKMVRPREVDDAELIFFDELNRAADAVQNAVLEIIQFRSINGERLPHVRACWAAINPPDGDYKVSDLDPALIDRFDAFVDIQPKPNVNYMAQTLPKPIAQALYSWWGEHNQSRRGMEHFISPRRLMKMGQVYMATSDFRPALPKWIQADRNKLGALLERAENDMKKLAQADTSGKLGDGPNPRFTYSEAWIHEKRLTVSKYMKDHQDDFDTHKAVLAVVERKHGKTLAENYAEVLDALKPSLLEGFIANLNPGKHESLKQGVTALKSHRYGTVANLRKHLGLA